MLIKFHRKEKHSKKGGYVTYSCYITLMKKENLIKKAQNVIAKVEGTKNKWCLGVASFLLALKTRAAEKIFAKDYDWITTQGSGGMFNDLEKTIKKEGSSLYLLILSGAVVVMIISAVLLGVKISTTKNSAKRDEAKSHLIYFVLGGILVFGAVTVLAMIAKIGSGLSA